MSNDGPETDDLGTTDYECYTATAARVDDVLTTAALCLAGPQTTEGTALLAAVWDRAARLCRHCGREPWGSDAASHYWLCLVPRQSSRASQHTPSVGVVQCGEPTLAGAAMQHTLRRVRTAKIRGTPLAPWWTAAMIDAACAHLDLVSLSSTTDVLTLLAWFAEDDSGAADRIAAALGPLRLSQMLLEVRDDPTATVVAVRRGERRPPAHALRRLVQRLVLASHEIRAAFASGLQSQYGGDAVWAVRIIGGCLAPRLELEPQGEERTFALHQAAWLFMKLISCSSHDRAAELLWAFGMIPRLIVEREAWEVIQAGARLMEAADAEARSTMARPLAWVLAGMCTVQAGRDFVHGRAQHLDALKENGRQPSDDFLIAVLALVQTRLSSTQ